MIVLRKPLPVFDVDLLGIAVMLALGATAYLVVVVPARAQADRRHRLVAELDAARQRTQSAEHELGRLEDLARDLRVLVQERIAQAPTRSEVNAIVNRIMLVAERTGLHISSLEPGSPEQVGDAFVCDVSIEGSGGGPAVVAFLDALAARVPCHSVLALSVDRPPAAADKACRVALRVRLHLLSDEIRLARGTP